MGTRLLLSLCGRTKYSCIELVQETRLSKNLEGYRCQNLVAIGQWQLVVHSDYSCVHEKTTWKWNIRKTIPTAGLKIGSCEPQPHEQLQTSSKTLANQQKAVTIWIQLQLHPRNRHKLALVQAGRILVIHANFVKTILYLSFLLRPSRF